MDGHPAALGAPKQRALLAASARQSQARGDGRAADRRALGRDAARIRRAVAAGLRPRASPRARRRADRDRRQGVSRRRRRRTSSISTASSACSSAAGRRSKRVARTTRPTTCETRSRSGAEPALADLPEEARRAADVGASRRAAARRRSSFASTRELACGRHDAVVAELEQLTRRASVPREVPAAAAARALPLRPPGGGARGLPQRP